jgi:hypothetical protein
MADKKGYLIVDHRASPGLNVPQNPLLGEGKVFEADTLTCAHCQRILILNPFRERPRGSCLKCGGRYICDFCVADMRRPDYVHRSFRELVDMVGSGDYMMAGGDFAHPILVPLKGK